mmetsp:Transcript_26628/g.32325  ORF Transcript_26628/g.32325 Transcript_26628/m.32325 type:complete len:381 (+) Transcript_26628:158-1300(+)
MVAHSECEGPKSARLGTRCPFLRLFSGQAASASADSCPVSADTEQLSQSIESLSRSQSAPTLNEVNEADVVPENTCRPVPPFATISMGFPGRVPPRFPGSGNNEGSSKSSRNENTPSQSKSSEGSNSSAEAKSDQAVRQSSASQASSTSANSSSISTSFQSTRTTASASSVPSQGGEVFVVRESKCPLSKIPFMKLALGELLYPTGKDGLPKLRKPTCPAVIVRLRAAFAATAPMQKLRKQHLGVRLAACAATSVGVNVPLGVWREHTEKFSAEWFVAIHASVPLIAMMRKASLVPQYAIVGTIVCAILGQVIGSRTERKRVKSSKVKMLLSLPPPPGCEGPASNTQCELSEGSNVSCALAHAVSSVSESHRSIDQAVRS